MRFWKRRKVQRTTLAALGLVIVVLGYLALRTAPEEYVPGERTEGLTDSLGRTLPDDYPDVRFDDVAAAAGLDFVHFSGTRTNRIPEDMGSGVALGDVDGDGWVDVFLANLAGPLDGRNAGWPDSAATCRLYRNRGDGRFEDVTAQAGLGVKDVAMGAAFVDVDGDADLDLLITSYGRCRLFRNEGGLRFVDVSVDSGVAAAEGFWTGIAVGDPDRDGDMDLYVCGYVRYREDLAGAEAVASQYGTDIPALLNPSTFEPERNLLLQNDGRGHFTDVAAALHVDNVQGRSLAATFADLTGDGAPDLYVANDVSDNVLYVNQGDGTFVDLTAQALVGDYRGAMGIAVGDHDGDQDLDLFITHWVAQENALYSNVTTDLGREGQAPRVLFIDDADRVGLGHIALHMVGWATAFLDFDNDGRRDLFVANGHTIPMRDDRTRLTPMRSQLFWNSGGKRGFYEVGAVAGDGFTTEWVGRGGAVFDYDLDGDEDLLMVRHGAPAALLRNEGGNAREGVLVRLRQAEGNCFAVGSTVQVTAAGHTWMAQSDTQGSYLSQNATGELWFGLGDATRIDTIAVTWPDGERESWGPCAAGSLVTWERGRSPRARPLPGRAPSAADRPPPAAVRREFFQVLGRATEARVAGDLSTAEKHYREALALWPGHSDCQYYLANTLLELHQAAEALALFEDITRQDPVSSRAFMQVGRIRMPGGDPALDDLGRARQAFERAHEINGEESGPVLMLGLVAVLEGDFEGGDQWLEDAARLNSRSVAALYYRAWVASLRGDPEAAQRLLAAAQQLAGQARAGVSTSNEGDTRTGTALVARTVQESDAPLERWRSLATREVDPETEFASLAQWIQRP